VDLLLSRGVLSQFSEPFYVRRRAFITRLFVLEKVWPNAKIGIVPSRRNELASASHARDGIRSNLVCWGL
jgi:hypothetical protein